MKSNMKKYILSSVILLLFVVSNGKLFAQSTQGKDFWVTFGFNGAHLMGRGGKQDNIESAYLTLQIRIVAVESAQVTFTYTEGGSETISIPAGTVYTKELTKEDKKKVCPSFAEPTNGITSKSLHITSTAPISVYAFNQYNATTDATNILPTGSLGYKYYQISRASNTLYNGQSSKYYVDGYTVIATQDGTTISDNGATKKLNKGQVYTFYTGTSTTDLTGRWVTSDKPVAYFVTNTITIIPQMTTLASADILYQQLMSVDMWGGKEFLVPVTTQGTERVRIMGSQAGTTVTHLGGTKISGTGGPNTYTIGAGQYIELEVNSSSKGCYIYSDKPIAVCSYMTTASHVSSTNGDPAMVWVPPFEQSIKQTTIAPFVPSLSGSGYSSLNTHYVLIITPTVTKNQTTMSVGQATAQPLTGGTWVDNTDSNHSYYTLKLTSGGGTSYTFGNSAGLIVLGYGTGPHESYYYLAGSAARELVPSFYVNTYTFRI